MSLDLDDEGLLERAARRPWEDVEAYWASMDAAVGDRPAPVVALGLEALSRNAHDLLRRAAGTPIRVASKSLRVRGALEAVLRLPGYRGVLAFTLREAIWLARSGTSDDIVVGYPTVDRGALAELGSDSELARRITLMVDDEAHLDAIDAAAPAYRRAPIRVCLDLDASWRTRALGHVGARRSPLHTPGQLRAFAAVVADRPRFDLVGVMAYEAQIAGVRDAPPGRPAEAAMMRAVQRGSAAELAQRRAEAVELVRGVADLEFVNGGGTGSIERTAAEACVTEVAAGSGLFGSHLFDGYRAFRVAPAVGIGLDVVRRPGPGLATALGGGWVASGAPGADRLPMPVWPRGLRLTAREGAGEVQTPLRGAAADRLRPGDRVWLRPAKAGEPMERTSGVVVVRGGEAIGDLATYRGEGMSFL